MWEYISQRIIFAYKRLIIGELALMQVYAHRNDLVVLNTEQFYGDLLHVV